MSEVKLSIIIVNYKLRKELRECIKSIKTKIPHEVIVIDNDKKNVGYGAGVNLGFKKAKGELLLITNPDTIWSKGSVEKLVTFYQSHPKCGVVAPDQMDEKGRLYEFVGTGKLTAVSAIFGLSIINKIFPNNPVSRRYWIRRKLGREVKEVEVAPGGAFLVSKKIFEKVGGFDENFFLYFEESDFCRRVKELGYRNYILQSTKITHLWGMSTKSSTKKDFYFKKSRIYYFKKYYGRFLSFFVEFLLNFDKWDLIFVLIAVFAFFLRFYRFYPNLRLDGEIGDNYLDIKNILNGTRTPLLGSPTSHPWLYFGPFFYWLSVPFFLIFNFDPVGPFFLILAVSILTVIFCYIFITKLFGKKVALISSFLISMSPLWLNLTRGERFFVFVPLLFFPFLYFLLVSIEGKQNRFFVAGLMLGAMISFHLTPIVFIPAIILLEVLKRKKSLLKDGLKTTLGIFVPNIPFVVYDFSHGFEMVKQFVLWIPYRILGFFGFYPKNTANINVIEKNLSSLYNFVSSSFFPNNSFLSFFIFLAIILFGIYLLLNIRKNTKAGSLALLFLFGYIGVFVHGDPPSHYYLPLFPIPVLILGFLVLKVLEYRLGKILLFTLFLLFVVINFRYYFSDKWFYKPTDRLVTGDVVPYEIQLQVSRQVVIDAGGEGFNLRRIGFNDQFSQNYSQDYRYLMWWLGNEPKDEKERLAYIIVEDTPNIYVRKLQQ